MKIAKTILKYLMYGLFLFLVTGFMAAMIKNSDNSKTSKRIFDSSRNFAAQPAATKSTYVPKTKPYKKNQSDCGRLNDRANDYANEANKFDLESAASACQMKKNLEEVLDLMNIMKKSECREFNEITNTTYLNLHKMSIKKCRQ